MADKLFELNNPNADIFAVPTESGPDEEDNMCSMIGDAVAHHVQALDPSGRQCWENFIHVGGKYVFELVDNYDPHDPDPMGMDVEDLDNYYENYKNISPKDKAVVDEAIEVERERRAASEDVYDRRDTLISYQDWAENPVAAKHVDIPTTPNSKTKFLGDTTTPFYDDMPVDHPDAERIINFLRMINRDDVDTWDDTDSKGRSFRKNIKRWIELQPFKSAFVQAKLTNILDQIADGETPEKVIPPALNTIEAKWAKYYHSVTIGKLFKDPVFQLLNQKHTEWQKKSLDGTNVYGDVKHIGMVLFQKFRKELRPYHWKLYRRLKKKFAPRVMFRGEDLNRCGIRKLCELFTIKKIKAVDAIDMRPFSSIGDFRTRTHIETASFVAKTAELVKKTIQERASMCITGRTVKPLTEYCKELFLLQKNKKLTLTASEWSSVWEYYRTVKNETIRQIQG